MSLFIVGLDTTIVNVALVAGRNGSTTSHTGSAAVIVANDYVTWIVLGLACIGAVLALVVR